MSIPIASYKSCPPVVVMTFPFALSIWIGLGVNSVDTAWVGPTCIAVVWWASYANDTMDELFQSAQTADECSCWRQTVAVWRLVHFHPTSIWNTLTFNKSILTLLKTETKKLLNIHIYATDSSRWRHEDYGRKAVVLRYWDVHFGHLVYALMSEVVTDSQCSYRRRLTRLVLIIMNELHLKVEECV